MAQAEVHGKCSPQASQPPQYRDLYDIPVGDTNGSGAGWYDVCTTEAGLDDCLTGLVFHNLPCFPLG